MTEEQTALIAVAIRQHSNTTKQAQIEARQKLKQQHTDARRTLRKIRQEELRRELADMLEQQQEELKRSDAKVLEQLTERLTVLADNVALATEIAAHDYRRIGAERIRKQAA